MSGYRKEEYHWGRNSDELPDDVTWASDALENLQLDRKARNLTSSWRSVAYQLPYTYTQAQLLYKTRACFAVTLMQIAFN